MTEKIHTPSNELALHSHNRDTNNNVSPEERRLNVLDSLEAAYAAKPYMDTAVDLFTAYGENEHGRGAYMEDFVKESPGLESLIRFAEAKAHLAAENGNVPELTGPEEIILSAYKAEAAMERAQSKCDYDNLTPDDLRKAAEEAYNRSKSVKGREWSNWRQMEQRLERFATFLETGGKDDQDLWQEFNASTERAEILLDSSTGTVTPTEYIRVSDVNTDARSMRGQAEMYEFLGELYPKDALDSNRVGLTDAEIAAAQAQIGKMNTSQSANEKTTEASESLVPDGVERNRFIKKFFSEHTDVTDETSLRVLRDYVIKQVRDELEWAGKRGAKARDNLALIFRLGTFNDATLETVEPEQRFTYQFLKNARPELTFSDFDAMTVEELSSAIGIDIRQEVEDYDKRTLHDPAVKKRFPNIDQ